MTGIHPNNRWNIKRAVYRRPRHYEEPVAPIKKQEGGVYDISQIKTGRKYALIVDGVKIRELTGGSFSDRPFKIVDAWIRTGILFDITEDTEWYEKKTEIR